MIHDRHKWAVDTLAVASPDHILEIGCGYGNAVSLICERLTEGKITAIDRSAKMIEAASKLNAHHIKQGKAEFLVAELYEVEWRQERFDKIFAMNVNMFWSNASRELAIMKERLSQGGSIYIFNQPPDASKIKPITDQTVQNLLDAGFHVLEITYGDQSPVTVVCVIAQISQNPS